MAVTSSTETISIFPQGSNITFDVSRKYDIKSIKKVNGGFIVEVGCQQFIFKTEKELFEAMSLFFKDQKKAQ